MHLTLTSNSAFGPVQASLPVGMHLCHLGYPINNQRFFPSVLGLLYSAQTVASNQHFIHHVFYPPPVSHFKCLNRVVSVVVAQGFVDKKPRFCR